MGCLSSWRGGLGALLGACSGRKMAKVSSSRMRAAGEQNTLSHYQAALLERNWRTGLQQPRAWQPLTSLAALLLGDTTATAKLGLLLLGPAAPAARLAAPAPAAAL